MPAPRTLAGKEVFPTFEPGSELGWSILAGQQAASVASDSFTYIVYKNPKWDWKTMNLDSDVALLDKTEDGAIDAMDPNMKPFFAHKGKLLMYHGWSDQAHRPAKQHQLLFERSEECGRREEGRR